MAKRDDGKRGGNGARGADRKRPAAPAEPPRAEEEEGRRVVDVAAVELVASAARLELEVALAYDAAADLCDDEDLEAHLREFAKDHRAHVDALNEALDAEGEGAVAPLPGPGSPILAGLVRVTGPLGDDVLVVTLLGCEQLTNLSYDAAVAYEWDAETEAMLRRFQADEERHVQWLAATHEALGGRVEESPQSPRS